jgi:hypothetical protein
MPAGAERWDESYVAGADLSALQGYAVKLNSSGEVIVVAAVTDRAIGVLMNKPTATHAARVREVGIAVCVSDGSGANIAAGDTVGYSSTGKIIKCTTADRPLLGRALEPSTADGTLISVELHNPGMVPFRTPA